MGQLRVVPKVEPLRFVEVPKGVSGQSPEKNDPGLVIRCGKFQLDVPGDCDAALLGRVLQLLDRL